MFLIQKMTKLGLLIPDLTAVYIIKWILLACTYGYKFVFLKCYWVVIAVSLR